MSDSLIELITESEEEESSGMIKHSKHEVMSYQVFIDEPIDEPRKYRDLINILYSSNQNDSINMFINSTGGQLGTTRAIIVAIEASNATVRSIINGECFSAASLLALSCDEIIVTDAAHMMVHTANFSTGGNTNMIQKHVDFSTKYIHKILDDAYAGFLTDNELKEVKMGVEFWFDAKEIRKRLAYRIKFQEAKMMRKNTGKTKLKPEELEQ